MTDTPGPVLLVDQDLFFVAKIRETLKSVGWPVITLKRQETLASHLAGPSQPTIILVHIGGPGDTWQADIAAARAAGLPVLAYGAHVETEAHTLARAAGATRVITNGKLASNLLEQIQRTLARAAVPSEDAPASGDPH